MNVGTKVEAVTRITEAGKEGSCEAVFPDARYIHAEAGDSGVVEHVGDGGNAVTVRFHPKGTATIVDPVNEVRVVRESA